MRTVDDNGLTTEKNIVSIDGPSIFHFFSVTHLLLNKENDDTVGIISRNPRRYTSTLPPSEVEDELTNRKELPKMGIVFEN